MAQPVCLQSLTPHRLRTIGSERLDPTGPCVTADISRAERAAQCPALTGYAITRPTHLNRRGEVHPAGA